MKTTTREAVLLFLLSIDTLKPNEQFNQAFDLYRSSAGKNLQQERSLNRMGFSTGTLKTVLYELKKIHKISDADLKSYESLEKTSCTTETPVIQFVPDGESLETIEALQKVITEAPAEVKQEIRFRDEFPFISDPNLPAELKILVTDKFNHYHAFADAHKELFAKVVEPYLVDKKEDFSEEQITNDVIFGLAKAAVENFEMDQLIYDEFVHYRDNNKVLGVHPIFKQRKLAESVDKMTMAEAAKRKANLENYIRRDTKKAEEATAPEDKTKFEEKVLDFKAELILVNLKLGESVTK